MSLGLMRGVGQLVTGTVGPSISGSNISTRVSSRQSQSQRQQAVPTLLTAPSTPQPLGRERSSRHGAPSSARRTSAVFVPEEETLLSLAANPPTTPEEQLGVDSLEPGFPRWTSVSPSTAPSARNAKASPRSHSHDARNAQAADEAAAGGSHASAQSALEGVPAELHCLLDPDAPVTLPAPGSLDISSLDNSRLDRLVAALGRGRATWRRALMLYEWLKASGHALDDRLCTTLIRVCADHGDAVSALGVYEWMRSPAEAGGADLHPTAYTYTAAMRAALGVGMLDRAMQVWSDSQAAGLTPDCRLCVTYIELCTRLGQTDKALAMYYQMRDAPSGSPMRPSVHAYTAAMRAATEGGRWTRALGVWEDMRRSSCQPTGHAYAAAISACAAGQDWMRAVALFDDMTARANIRPDVVSCTALVTALAAAGEADKAEAVVHWMQKSGLKPNVRTFTALLTAMGNARQWQRAINLLFSMQKPENGSVQPNAYTYSALIKALGEHGQWQLAEAVFEDVETQVRTARAHAHADSQHTAPVTRAQQAERLTVFKRLMTVAAVADQTQQQTPYVSFAAAAAAAAPAAAGVAQVVQHLPLVDSASLTPTSSSNGAAQSASQAVSSSSKAQAPMSPVSLNGHTAPQSAALSWSTSSQVSNIETAGSRMSSRPPSTPPTPLSPSSTQSPAAATPISIPAGHAREDLSNQRNWSHPTQLNGIQWNANLLASSPDSSSAFLAVPPATASHPTNDRSLLEAQAAAGGFYEQATDSMMAGQYMSASRLGGESAGQTSLRIRGGAETPRDSNGFSLFSSQPLRDTTSQSGHDSSHGSQGGHHSNHAGAHTPLVNEVVCGAMMLAYERAGRWVEAVRMLERARMLGLQPNTVMYNTAISAAGKAGQLDIAEQLYMATPARDAVTYETMVAAYGMAGRPDKAEQTLRQMTQSGYRPRDYAYCGLIAAHSLAGNTDAAMAVRKRMKQDGVQPTVHVYNALLAACERAHRYEQALELLHAMKREGVEANVLTSQLCQVVGRAGAQTVESQQVAAAALSAVFAAAGGLLMRAGMF